MVVVVSTLYMYMYVTLGYGKIFEGLKFWKSVKNKVWTIFDFCI